MGVQVSRIMLYYALFHESRQYLVMIVLQIITIYVQLMYNLIEVLDKKGPNFLQRKTNKYYRPFNMI